MNRLVLLWLGLFVLLGCRSTAPKSKVEIHVFQGETMGTYYNVRYVNETSVVKKNQIDSVLVSFNEALSTWIPSSFISGINSENRTDLQVDGREQAHFFRNFLLAKEMYALTEGFFEPTLNPLINFWGFGYDPKEPKKDLSKIPELLGLVGFDKWTFKVSDHLLDIKKPARSSLDFSALSKGDGVDVLADFLESHGLENYFIDIGGEVTAKGAKPENSPWIVGISKPEEGAAMNETEFLIKLEEKSIATSGNYRRYYEENGTKFSHIINPKTGLSERSNLLSSSIIHKDCSKADAMATACMVMGVERCKNIINNSSEYEALLIFANEDGELSAWKTKGFEKLILE